MSLNADTQHGQRGFNMESGLYILKSSEINSGIDLEMNLYSGLNVAPVTNPKISNNLSNLDLISGTHRRQNNINKLTNMFIGKFINVKQENKLQTETDLNPNRRLDLNAVSIINNGNTIT